MLKRTFSTCHACDTPEGMILGLTPSCQPFAGAASLMHTVLWKFILIINLTRVDLEGVRFDPEAAQLSMRCEGSWRGCLLAHLGAPWQAAKLEKKKYEAKGRLVPTHVRARYNRSTGT